MSRVVARKTEARFSLSLFVLTVALFLSGFLLALAFLFPEVWRVQLAAGFFAFTGVFLAAHLSNAFVEYFFHRYVLHAPLIPFLRHFYRQHTLHHGLTKITWKRVICADGQAELRVVNQYPIVEDGQHQASFFPWYTFGIFGILAIPIFALGQWLFPGAPVFLGGFVALAWSLALYEIWHALEHYPNEKWAPLLQHQRWGWFWKRAYSFHLRHHADVLSNESISGFFGLPIADWIFGTYARARILYENGAIAGVDDFKSPRPRFFIRWLDKLAGRES